MKKALLLTALLAVLALSLAACGDGGGGDGASAPSSASQGGSTETSSQGASEATPSQGTATTVDGNWTGTYESTAGDTGTFQFQLKQSGSKFSGPFTLNNAACISSAKISGSVSGGKIDFGAVQGSQRISYTGTVKGDTMSGTYSAPAACQNAKGTWKATRSG